MKSHSLRARDARKQAGRLFGETLDFCRSWLFGNGYLPSWTLARIGLFFVGLLFLALALKSHWVSVPVSYEGDGIALIKDSIYTKPLKIILAALIVLAALCSVLFLLKRKWTRILEVGCLLAAIAIPILLWFPQWVVVQDVELSGDAAWLQQQHDNMSWLGGDVFRAHSERAVGAALAVDVQEPPLRLAAFRSPMVTLGSMGVRELPDLVWWLGYNPAFCQFVGKGWIMGMMGLAIILVVCMSSLPRGMKKVRVQVLVRVAVTATLISCIILSLALTPIFRGGKQLMSCRDAVLEGDPKLGLFYLEQACETIPALKFDTSVIHQRGLLQSMLGKTDQPSAQLYNAWMLEEKGYPKRAREILMSLSNQREDLSRELSREVSRGWVRMVASQINSGKIGQSFLHLNELLKHEPGCLQGRFHMQTVCLKVGEVEMNAQCHEEIEAFYRHFQRKDKKGLLAASAWILSQGQLEAGLVAQAGLTRQKSKGF